MMTPKEKMIAALAGVKKSSLKFEVDEGFHSLPAHLIEHHFINIRGPRGGYKGAIFIERWKESGEVVYTAFHSSGMNSTGPFGRMFRSVDEKKVVDYINKVY